MIVLNFIIKNRFICYPITLSFKIFKKNPSLKLHYVDIFLLLHRVLPYKFHEYYPKCNEINPNYTIS